MKVKRAISKEDSESSLIKNKKIYEKHKKILDKHKNHAIIKLTIKVKYLI